MTQLVAGEHRAGKTYAARKLLEHGPLTRKEFLEITGWTVGQVAGCIEWLRCKGRITETRGVYELTPRFTPIWN